MPWAARLRWVKNGKLGGHLIFTPDFTPGAEEQEHEGGNGNTCRFGDGDAEGEDEGGVEEGAGVVKGDGGVSDEVMDGGEPLGVGIEGCGGGGISGEYEGKARGARAGFYLSRGSSVAMH